MLATGLGVMVTRCMSMCFCIDMQPPLVFLAWLGRHAGVKYNKTNLIHAWCHSMAIKNGCLCFRLHCLDCRKYEVPV